METLHTLLLVICSLHTITRDAGSSKVTSKKGNLSSPDVDRKQMRRDEELGTLSYGKGEKRILRRNQSVHKIGSASILLKVNTSEGRKRWHPNPPEKNNADKRYVTMKGFSSMDVFPADKGYRSNWPEYFPQDSPYSLNAEKVEDNVEQMLTKPPMLGYIGPDGVEQPDENFERNPPITPESSPIFKQHGAAHMEEHGYGTGGSRGQDATLSHATATGLETNFRPKIVKEGRNNGNRNTSNEIDVNFASAPETLTQEEQGKKPSTLNSMYQDELGTDESALQNPEKIVDNGEGKDAESVSDDQLRQVDLIAPSGVENLATSTNQMSSTTEKSPNGIKYRESSETVHSKPIALEKVGLTNDHRHHTNPEPAAYEEAPTPVNETSTVAKLNVKASYYNPLIKSPVMVGEASPKDSYHKKPVLGKGKTLPKHKVHIKTTAMVGATSPKNNHQEKAAAVESVMIPEKSGKEIAIAVGGKPLPKFSDQENAAAVEGVTLPEKSGKEIAIALWGKPLPKFSDQENAAAVEGVTIPEKSGEEIAMSMSEATSPTNSVQEKAAAVEGVTIPETIGEEKAMAEAGVKLPKNKHKKKAVSLGGVKVPKHSGEAKAIKVAGKALPKHKHHQAKASEVHGVMLPEISSEEKAVAQGVEALPKNEYQEQGTAVHGVTLPEINSDEKAVAQGVETLPKNEYQGQGTAVHGVTLPEISAEEKAVAQGVETLPKNEYQGQGTAIEGETLAKANYHQTTTAMEGKALTAAAQTSTQHKPRGKPNAISVATSSKVNYVQNTSTTEGEPLPENNYLNNASAVEGGEIISTGNQDKDVSLNPSIDNIQMIGGTEYENEKQNTFDHKQKNLNSNKHKYVEGTTEVKEFDIDSLNAPVSLAESETATQETEGGGRQYDSYLNCIDCRDVTPKITHDRENESGGSFVPLPQGSTKLEQPYMGKQVKQLLSEGTVLAQGERKSGLSGRTPKKRRHSVKKPRHVEEEWDYTRHETTFSPSHPSQDEARLGSPPQGVAKYLASSPIHEENAGYPLYHIPTSADAAAIPDMHRPQPPNFGCNPYEVLTSSSLNGTAFTTDHYPCGPESNHEIEGHQHPDEDFKPPAFVAHHSPFGDFSEMPPHGGMMSPHNNPPHGMPSAFSGPANPSNYKVTLNDIYMKQVVTKTPNGPNKQTAEFKKDILHPKWEKKSDVKEHTSKAHDDEEIIRDGDLITKRSSTSKKAASARKREPMLESVPVEYAGHGPIRGGQLAVEIPEKLPALIRKKVKQETTKKESKEATKEAPKKQDTKPCQPQPIIIITSAMYKGRKARNLTDTLPQKKRKTRRRARKLKHGLRLKKPETDRYSRAEIPTDDRGYITNALVQDHREVKITGDKAGKLADAITSHVEENEELQTELCQKERANGELMGKLYAQKENHGRLANALCAQQEKNGQLVDVVSSHEDKCGKLVGAVSAHEHENKILNDALSTHEEHNERLTDALQGEKERSDRLEAALHTTQDHNAQFDTTAHLQGGGCSQLVSQQCPCVNADQQPVSIGCGHSIEPQPHDPHVACSPQQPPCVPVQTNAPCPDGCQLATTQESTPHLNNFVIIGGKNRPAAGPSDVHTVAQSHLPLRSGMGLNGDYASTVPPQRTLDHHAAPVAAPISSGTYDFPNVIHQIDSGYPVFNIPSHYPEVIIPDYHKPLPPLYGINPYEVLTSSELNGTAYKTEHYDPSKAPTDLRPDLIPVQKNRVSTAVDSTQAVVSHKKDKIRGKSFKKLQKMSTKKTLEEKNSKKMKTDPLKRTNTWRKESKHRIRKRRNTRSVHTKLK